MKTNFGILGCGHIAGRFARALGLSQSGRLHAAAARELPRAQAFVEKYGGTQAYSDYQALIEDEAVDIVYISLVHNLHYEVARRCVERGKAVLCEKPFFLHERDARELTALAGEKGVLIMEGMWTRCLPAYRTAKAWARDGRVGGIKLIDAAFCYRHPLTDPANPHRLYNPETAGGALYDLGVYPYAFATGILEERPEEIKAVLHRAPTGVDETVCMSLRFPGGALANASASIGVTSCGDAWIYGTQGSIRLPRFWSARRCELYGEDGELLDSVEDEQQEGFVHEIEHVAQLYRQGMTESPLVPMADCIDFARAAEEILGCGGRGVGAGPR